MWKSIDEFPGYRFCDSGVIQSCLAKTKRAPSLPYRFGDLWHDMKPQTVKKDNGKHYHKVSLRHRSGRMVQRMVHSLILEAFIGPRPTGLVSRHLNDNGTDNRLVNLQWGTSAENEADKERNGNKLVGENLPWSKLDSSTVAEIRTRIRNGESDLALSRSYMVSRATINDIRRKRTWAHVA